MGEDLLLYIGETAVVILIILAIRVIIKKEKAKEEAIKFLKELEHDMYEVVINILSDMDPNNFTTLNDYESYALNKIYNALWDFINRKLEEIENKDILSILARKYLTKERVRSFVKDYINKNSTQEIVVNTYGFNVIESEYDTMIEQDKELQSEYSDPNEYNEDVDKNNYDYEAPVEEIHTEEEIETINPQQDIDEEEYSEDDSSVEDITEYIEEKKNKAGRTVFYLIKPDGKRQQISREKANASGLEIRKIINIMED